MTDREEKKPPTPRRTTPFPGFINTFLRRQGVRSLAALEYDQEREAKALALEKFWSQHQLPGYADAIVASPRARHYRTTSKRRIRVDKGVVLADFAASEEALPAHALHLLEAEPHRLIYDLLLGFLRKPAYLDFARRLHFIIIRGSYETFSVIFNVDRFDAAVMRKGKLLADHLQDSGLGIVSVFMFLDPSRSEYYFESKRPDAAMTFRKLYGTEKLSVTVNGRRFFYDPTGFSQVNESILPLLVEKVQGLLGRLANGQLADLYCGYGFFALQLAGGYDRVLAMDVSSAAIRDAAANKHHLCRDAEIRFRAQSIESRSLRRFLQPSASGREHILLDPPRQGVAEGVIPYLAERRSDKIVHIFCGIEQIPHHLPLWLQAGYRLTRAIPLDMFPGTPNLELCLLFEPRPPAPPLQGKETQKKKTAKPASTAKKPLREPKSAERIKNKKMHYSGKLKRGRSQVRKEK